MNEYRYNDVVIGMEEHFTTTITQKMMDAFCAITGDTNPLHSDDTFAIVRGFPSRVGYGMLTASFLSTLAGVYLPGRNSLIHEIKIEFPKPVFVGDELVISGTVTEKNDLFKTFTVKVIVRNAAGEKVCRGKMKMGVRE